jgi:hypothetical protein
VEWPQAAGGEFGVPRLRVELRHGGEDRRTIEVTG